ncbi:hypothetical protein LJC07_04825 [Christensenellaceae bacterium OttesenSCG-928-L17]|nr:hypothetical protein [Christensenellaceae bacterium OttesenSCG-928-L17]
MTKTNNGDWLDKILKNSMGKYEMGFVAHGKDIEKHFEEYAAEVKQQILDHIHKNYVPKEDYLAHLDAEFIRGRLDGVDEVLRDMEYTDPRIEDDIVGFDIPSDWVKIDDVYIWFNALNKLHSKYKHSNWRGLRGFVYKKPNGCFVAPFCGKLLDVIKDCKDEFREVSNDKAD